CWRNDSAFQHLLYRGLLALFSLVFVELKRIAALCPTDIVGYIRSYSGQPRFELPLCLIEAGLAGDLGHHDPYARLMSSVIGIANPFELPENYNQPRAVSTFLEQLIESLVIALIIERHKLLIAQTVVADLRAHKPPVQTCNMISL